MDLALIGVLGLIAVLVLMFIGIPIPFGMLCVGVVGISIIRSPSAAAQLMAADLLTNFSSYNLTVGPLFGLMGFLAYYSGLGSDLFRMVNSYVGHWPGGLAVATQLACTGFGAICGSAPATTSTMCAVAYPEMRKYGYAPEIAGPGLVTGGLIACLIPPSSTFIVYGMATDVSIGALFIGGIGPGILISIVECAVIFVIARRHPERAPRAAKIGWKERIQYTLGGGLVEVAFVFLLSIGGMFAGFFTPTEGGAVGAFGMLLILVVRSRLTFRKFLESLWAGVRMQAMVYMLLGCASVFSRLFTMSTVPTKIGVFVGKLALPSWIILAVILVIYFILGMVTDLMSMMLITLPVFYPIVCGTLGYSPVWFGIIITIMVGVGGLTPPIGNGIFMVRAFTLWDTESNLSKLFRGSVPFVVGILISVVILILFPEICTWLPSLKYTV